MIPVSKGQKAVRACTIRLLNLGHAKYEKVAIYAVNQRISNVCRIAGAASLPVTLPRSVLFSILTLIRYIVNIIDIFICILYFMHKYFPLILSFLPDLLFPR